MVNLTKAMALELGPHGILVNGVAPGSTLTEGTKQLFYGPDGQFSSSVQQMLAHIPLGRPGTTDEIAVAVLSWPIPKTATPTATSSPSTADGRPVTSASSKRVFHTASFYHQRFFP